jgi:hypothetical protein
MSAKRDELVPHLGVHDIRDFLTPKGTQPPQTIMTVATELADPLSSGSTPAAA